MTASRNSQTPTDKKQQGRKPRNYLKAHPPKNAAKKVEEVLNTPMAEPGMLVRPEYIREIRQALGLTQVEFAGILECTNIAIHMWEQKGIDNPKGPAYGNLRTMVALLKHSFRFSGSIKPATVCDLIAAAAKKTLIERFFAKAGEMEPEVLAAINGGNLNSVLLALVVELGEPARSS